MSQTLSVAAARERAAATRDHCVFTTMSTESGTGPLYVVKDNIDVRGLPTMAGSGWSARSHPAALDAPVVSSFRRAGYVMLGKTNMHEWGLGSSGQNPHFGTTLNPVDPTRLAGGSSGGSAAAVGLGLVDVALGTDTGGSIRIPSGLCGVVGLRPTYGRVSTAGVAPLAQSLDTVGPIARSLEKLEEVLPLLGLEADPAETSLTRSLRVGVASSWVSQLDESVAAVWDRVLSTAHTSPDVPELEEFVDPGLTILYYEGSRNIRTQYETAPETLGDDVKHLVREGLELSDSEYQAARAQQQVLRQAIDAVFDDVDVLLLPTTRTVAPLINENALALREKLTPFTRPFGLSGHPVVSVPFPRASGELPVGVQMVGPRGSDALLIQIAKRISAAWGPL